MDFLDYKYALVTGASSGIGREYAVQLAARGYGVVLVSNQDEANRVVAEQIAAEYKVPTFPYYMDLTADGAAKQLWKWTIEQRLEVEVLVCNAGILLFGRMVAMSTEKLQNIVTLHCTSTTLLCRYFGEAMCARKRGFILLMSSSAAWMPYPSIAAYAATKAYLRSFSRAIHGEMAMEGVRVTAVFPGAVDTPLYQLSEKMRRRLVWWGGHVNTSIYCTERSIGSFQRALSVYPRDIYEDFSRGLSFNSGLRHPIVVADSSGKTFDRVGFRVPPEF